MQRLVAISTCLLLSLAVGSCGEPEPHYDGRPLSAWLEDLSDEDREVRFLAAQAMGLVGAEGADSTDVLIERLEVETDARVVKSLGASLSFRMALYGPLSSHPGYPEDERDFHSPESGRIPFEQPDPSRWVPALIKLLEHPAADRRIAAARSLRNLGPVGRPGADALSAHLLDPDWEVRKLAAEALVEFGPPYSEPARLTLIEVEAIPPRFSFLSDWYRRGTEGLPDLTAYARELPPDRRILFPTEAYPEASEAIISRIREMTEVGSEAEQADAYLLLPRMAPATLPILLDELASPDAARSDRAMAALAQARGRAGSALATVAEFLDDADPERRRTAAHTMEAIGYAPGIAPTLAGALEASDPEIRRAAAAILARGGSDAKPAIPALGAALGDPDRRVQEAALRSLKELGADAGEAAPALARALGDPEEAFREKAAETLWRIGPAAAPAVDALMMAASDESAEVRHDAVIALGAIGPASRRAIPTLLAALDDPEGDVRGSAWSALARLGPDAAEAAPALVQRYEKASSAHRERIVRTLAVIAPADERTHRVLGLAFHDPDVNSIESLKKLGGAGVPLLIRLLGECTTTSCRKVPISLLMDLRRDAAPAAPALLEALRADPELVGISYRAMQAFGPEVIPMLEAASNDEAPHVREAVGIALDSMRQSYPGHFQ